MVLNHLKYAGRAETRHDLCIGVLAASLRKVDGMAEDIFDILRHSIQITFGRTDPFDRLSDLLLHSPNYACFDIFQSTRQVLAFSWCLS